MGVETAADAAALLLAAVCGQHCAVSSHPHAAEVCAGARWVCHVQVQTLLASLVLKYKR